MKANSVCWLRSADATYSGHVAVLADGYVFVVGYSSGVTGISPACSI